MLFLFQKKGMMISQSIPGEYLTVIDFFRKRLLNQEILPFNIKMKGV